MYPIVNNIINLYSQQLTQQRYTYVGILSVRGISVLAGSPAIGPINCGTATA